MANLKSDIDTGATSWIRNRLDRPMPAIWSIISWLLSTVAFVGLTGLLGGPTEGDVSESVYGTWSIEHGNLACIYPPLASHRLDVLANPFALAAPLYSLLSGGLAALFRIGHSVPFPTSRQLGVNCINAFSAIFNWSVKSSSILPTIRLAYFVWPILAIGVVSLVRSANRGRSSGWEALALFMVAGTSPVLMSITYYFHPQDLLAMGLLLIGVAVSLKQRWLVAGVLLGLAFCSQQFALLVAAPLFVIAPSRDRAKYLAGMILAVVVVDVPIIIATSGRGVKTVLFGSSRVGSNIRTFGGTVLWELDLHGILIFTISRVLPILAATGFTWFFARRYGSELLRPVPVMSIVAVALITRLIFEVNLFGYYFMAAAVALVLLDVAQQRIRGELLAWIALLMVSFNPVHIGLVSNLKGWSLTLSNAIPIVLMALVGLSVLFDITRRRFRAYKVAWIVVVSLTSETYLWGITRPIYVPPDWLWQLVLIPTALALALTPLLGWTGSVASVKSQSQLLQGAQVGPPN
jgi:hypothetical protein